MLSPYSKVGDPHPGQPYKGSNFCAFLPDNKEGRKTAMLLKRAFEQGLTFQIKSCDGEERVTWGLIPHKTSWDGGKTRYGPAHPKLPGVFWGGFIWQLEEENHELQLNKSWHGWLFQAPTMVELVPPFTSADRAAVVWQTDPGILPPELKPLPIPHP